MSLHETLQHRRAIRYYDPEKPLDSARVEECLRQATLAPTSSNMQLYRCYHITDPAVIAALTPACLGQSTISTAKEVVVFAITPSRWRERVDHLFPRIVEDIHKHQPEEKWAKYEAMQREYMTKVVPFLYSRGCKVWGWARHLVMNSIALFRPMMRQGTEGDMKTVLHKSCALVAQTFMLAMSEAGYDTCPIEGFDARRVRKALGLPSPSNLRSSSPAVSVMRSAPWATASAYPSRASTSVSGSKTAPPIRAPHPSP